MLSHIKVYSKKRKTIGLKIEGLKVFLIIPYKKNSLNQKIREKQAEKFLETKKDRVLSVLEKNKYMDSVFFDYSKETFLKYKLEAEELCKKKLKYRGEKMGLCYNKLTIKNLKTKWGSCSIKRNLNFSYKIIFLSEEDQDYLIVHELSHLKFMNHKKEFRDLVCSTLGDEKFRKYKIGKINIK